MFLITFALLARRVSVCPGGLQRKLGRKTHLNKSRASENVHDERLRRPNMTFLLQMGAGQVPADKAAVSTFPEM